MHITFHGGAGGVTGSKHLVEVAGKRILLDCGLFQGRRRLTRDLNSALPFDVKSIDAVVLTHGHLDHCGAIPLMVKLGYTGPIYTTAATRDVTEWILLDSAHIQVHDLAYMRKHHIEGAEFAEPLYTPEDVSQAMKQFQAVPYVSEKIYKSDWLEILPNIKIKFYDAGHILGSAVITLEAQEEGKTVRLAYTGDLGRTNTPLLRDPEYIEEEVPVLLMESTYGNRLHRPIAQAAEHLAEVVKRVHARGGKIIVPSFALGRTQELVYMLHKLTDEGKIPRLPTYVDSPLASKLTEVFIKHPENYDTESWQEFGAKGELPLYYRNLTYVSSTEESKILNTQAGPFLVISASGMCEAGRILHHLKNGVEDPKNLILITGFQAEYTLGRRLVEGEKNIRIFGERYRVKAEVEVLNELSAHADAEGLQAYTEHTPGLGHLYLVHGETKQAMGLKDHLQTLHPDWVIRVPQMGDSINFNPK
jgi:metallo-beta-lactamase family protein